MPTKITISQEGARWVARFPFDWATKDVVKAAGFKFDGQAKLWYTTDATIAAKLNPDAADQANQAIEQSRAATVSAAVAATVPVPAGLAYLPYQVAGITYAMDRPGVLLGDEMGLGKTIQAIGVINADPTVKSVLVVCPASLKINWSRELAKWLVRPTTIEIANGAFPTAAIVIINYDVLVKHRAAIMARHWDMLIVDECHMVKNGKAQRTRALLGRWDADEAKRVEPIKATRRIFITGTPIVNRPIELWTLVRALDPFGLGRGFRAFAERYTNAHHNGYGMDYSGAANLDELQQRMRAKFLVRRLKSEVLTELPAKRRQIIVLATNGASAAVEAERRVFEAHEAAMKSAQAAMKAAKAAQDKAAYEAAVRALRDAQKIAFSEMSKKRHETAVAKIPHVIEHVTECLESEGKLIVFAHHHDVVHALADAFPGAAIVTGETAVAKRQVEVDRFQTDPNCRVFIGSIQAAGVGLTLTAASHVIFAELDWVPGNVSQAEDRAHRIGQKDAVLVQHLVFDRSIDARMAHVIVEKQTVIDAALDNPTAKIEAAELPEADETDDLLAGLAELDARSAPDDLTIPF